MTNRHTVKLQGVFLKLSVVNEQKKYITLPITNKDALLKSVTIISLGVEGEHSNRIEQVSNILHNTSGSRDSVSVQLLGTQKGTLLLLEASKSALRHIQPFI
jgi:hypothetical protein